MPVTCECDLLDRSDMEPGLPPWPVVGKLVSETFDRGESAGWEALWTLDGPATAGDERVWVCRLGEPTVCDLFALDADLTVDEVLSDDVSIVRFLASFSGALRGPRGASRGEPAARRLESIERCIVAPSLSEGERAIV